MDINQIATHIVEKILPNHLQFVVHYIEHESDGSVSIQYTERTQKIFNEIIQILEKQ